MALPDFGDVREMMTSSFHWTIPRLPEDKNVQSPSFQFWGANWKIECRNFIDHLGFCVVRNKWVQDGDDQEVVFALNIMMEDRTRWEICYDMFTFTEEENQSHFSFIEKETVLDKIEPLHNLTISCILYGTYTDVATRRSEEDCTKEPETQNTQDQVNLRRSGIKDFEILSRNFKDLLATAQDTDVTVKVDDREFPAHKLILGARSPVFYKMFKLDMVEKKKGIVDITDCTPDAFKEFLLYIYSGQLDKISRNTAFDLYLLSDKYDVRELKSASLEFIAEDLCIDTFCDVIHMALQHEETVLLEAATKFFAKNLKKIIVSIKWQSFIKENPIKANELYIKALNDVLPE